MAFMNPKEMPASAHLRLNRIQLVSRIAKYVCLGVLVYSMVYSIWMRMSVASGWILLIGAAQGGIWIWFRKLWRLPRFQDHTRLVVAMVLIQILFWVGCEQLMGAASFKSNAGINLVLMVFQLVTWFWYWKLARLFRLYERGRIFAVETIGCIKTLGLVCIIGWLVGSACQLLSKASQHSPAALPVNAKVISVRHFIFTGFFSFDFGTGINFGPFLIGVIIVLIAWIMDEGRKIQEEQALTV
jgi:hypothetical protein